MSTEYRQKGISLIELIMFIVIVSVGIAGILSVMNVTTQASADPLIRKQALAIAESLLEEITLQPFTYCDPDDPAAATATERRRLLLPSALVPSDRVIRQRSPAVMSRNVAQRNADKSAITTVLSMRRHPRTSGIARDYPAWSAYNASVAISRSGGILGVPQMTYCRSMCRVGPGNTDITVTGYRFRYAPNAVP